MHRLSIGDDVNARAFLASAIRECDNIVFNESSVNISRGIDSYAHSYHILVRTKCNSYALHALIASQDPTVKPNVEIYVGNTFFSPCAMIFAFI